MKNRMMKVWALVGFLAVAGVGCDNTAQQALDQTGRGVPKAVSAAGLSRHYVEVNFASPAGTEAADAARYQIRQNGTPLRVREATLTEDGRQVILTTDTQVEAAEYVLNVQSGELTEGSAQPAGSVSPGDGGIVFLGAGGFEPQLLSAISLSNTTVLLTFGIRMDRPTTQNRLFYDISNPDLNILGAVLAADDVALTLTTSAQENVLYTVKATNVRSNIYTYGGYLIDPDSSTATFYGIPPNDNVAPRLIDAKATSETTILLSFSEPVNHNAANPTNYSIAPSLVITDSEQNVYKTQILLTTLPMIKGTVYTVTASNMRDLTTPGNLIDPAFNSKSFTFAGAAGLGGDGDADSYLPRVVGAIATSDHHVVVQFSEPMAANAADKTKYEITGPETVFLYVDDAILSTDSTSVRLTTTVQADYDYTVHVVGVTDLAGNPLAAPNLLGFPGGFDPTRATFRGIVEVEADGVTDTDGDGFADWFETAGWEILVGLANGGVKRAFVTSDPKKPDTDDDGFTDGEENAHNWDPRTNDTDADRIDDATEFNLWYSDPADQDSDDDGIDDYTEIEFFKTNPAVADSDGDGFSDDEELFVMNRNPLVADLPLPQITVSDIALELNITSSYTDEEGVTRSVTDMTSATFTQSRTQTLGTSDTTSIESENEFGQEIGFEIGSGSGGLAWKASAKVNFSQSQARGYSSTISRESSETSQQEYQESVTNALETSERRSVTRNIDSAIVQATVNISNKSDLAFSITNIELSLLQQDRFAGLTFTPIAALRPTGASDPTNQPVFNLGPLDSERGPIIFENTTVFPNRIDALMREPTGLVFEVVNFDVTDETGRNLVFTSQDVADRTVGVTIDFGDGRVENYRIATVSVFDDFGKQSGISMRRALELVDITRAGQETWATPADMVNGTVMRLKIGATTIATATADATPTVAEMCAALANTWNASLNATALTITATDKMTYVELRADDADNAFTVTSEVVGTGTLEITTPTPAGHDVDRSYETILSPRTLPDMTTIDVESLIRIRDVENTSDELKFWVAVTSNTNLDPNSDFSDIPLRAHETILLMYTSDEDEDGLFAREEYLYGSLDTDTDSDDDTLLDFYEVRTGWTVGKVPGLPYKVFPSPARPDSDLDGLEDNKELMALTDPNRADTDEDGLSDPSEIEDTYSIALFDGDVDLSNTKVLTVIPFSDWAIIAGPDGVCDTTTATGDDTLAETSGNPTGAQICIAAGPNGVIDTTLADDDIKAAAPKIDAGPDGVCDTTTASGDDVVEFINDADDMPENKGVLGKVCISAGTDGMLQTAAADDDFVRVAHRGLFGTDPVRTDTDLDGIGDGRELLLGTNPNTRDAGNVIDTDGDGMFDKEEEDGWFIAGTMTLVNSDKNVADTDHDGIPDVIERAIGSNPRSLDTDGDGLLDYIEFDVENPPINGAPLYNAVVLELSLQRCEDANSCSYVAPPGSAVVSTHPSRTDTDGDTRNDFAEVNVSWTVSVTGLDAYTVFSDPIRPDADSDGLNDAVEFTRGTDPNDGNTDDDNANDGYEVNTRLTNPLSPDQRVRFKYVSVLINAACDEAGIGFDDYTEWHGDLIVIDPDGVSETVFTKATESEQGDCCSSAANDIPATYAVNVERTFILVPGDSFKATSANLIEHDGIHQDDHSSDDSFGVLNQEYVYPVSSGNEVLNPTGTGCSTMFNVNVTLTVD